MMCVALIVTSILVIQPSGGPGVPGLTALSGFVDDGIVLKFEFPQSECVDLVAAEGLATLNIFLRDPCCNPEQIDIQMALDYLSSSNPGCSVTHTGGRVVFAVLWSDIASTLLGASGKPGRNPGFQSYKVVNVFAAEVDLP